jgi:hypothetical protein
VKNLRVPTKEKATNEGHTQVELATEIRLRAYKLYEQRGRVDGHALEDWIQAEAEILESEQRPVAA